MYKHMCFISCYTSVSAFTCTLTFHTCVHMWFKVMGIFVSAVCMSKFYISIYICTYVHIIFTWLNTKAFIVKNWCGSYIFKHGHYLILIKDVYAHNFEIHHDIDQVWWSFDMQSLIKEIHLYILKYICTYVCMYVCIYNFCAYNI